MRFFCKKIKASLLVLLMAIGAIGTMLPSPLAQGPDYVDIYGFGEGWVIDRFGNRTNATLEIDGSIDLSISEIRNFVFATGIIEFGDTRLELPLDGQAFKAFVGWDTSNVSWENPSITYIDVGNRTLKRYDNAEEMHANHMILNSSSNNFTLATETFQEENGWMHGNFTLEDETYEIAVTFESSTLAGSIQQLNIAPGGGFELDVPLRLQWEYMPNLHRALRGCGPASAAMVEEYYEGTHPNLNYIWNWRSADFGWVAQDVADYLNAHVEETGFIAQDLEGTKEYCREWCKGTLRWEFPIVVFIKGHFAVYHWVVMHGWEEEGNNKWFWIRNPSLGGWNTYLWYTNKPWFHWSPFDSHTFDKHVWRFTPYGKVRCVH